ncbi:MAG: UDP-3-O-(3-hydroxymyristoyl)glucosamine N-acyltransferase [Halanaerobiales bacterium]|nr:UDP-3-O-(3-hydroxymyristoyl)glucosamine N-acyltransferase [Bacillota bacterium]HOA40188.1 UDP-3-O-(3-hydroxymyristoyl)glucosamine N-acyltransferase [Halanaerobiales bacterium]HPZ62470.1 UDP-3-O-(3-hydroxymyristoyl)glucosamine N-acyltransferase [Halanaerobiales bacterium]HQD03648.1 UDP-3-O-(3-hydroxymyristoyl)glucosamine N-acyltransferase [Halanaerobiales bacterium]
MANDRSFYTVGELAELIRGRVIGDPDLKIKGIAGVAESKEEDLTFAEDKKYLAEAEKSRAAAIIVPENISESRKTIIAVKNPRLAYARVAALFAPAVFYDPGIHPTAVISPKARIGKNVSIHAHVVVEEDVVIGDNVALAPGVFIGKGSRIGDNTVLHPNVVVEYDSVIGSNVIIHAGTVIGSDGYGFVSVADGHHKIPQLGNVIIEDNVEIGSNVSIDRGASGPTVIGAGSKIDNLVQIAHNVKIGPDCLIIAQVGIAGSTEVGKRVILAGKTGVVGHIRIGDQAVIASDSVVTKDVPAGVFYSGRPAHDHKAALREQAAIRKLPDLMKKIKELEEKIRRLEEKEEE